MPTDYCFGPTDKSYPPGTSITLFDATNPITLNAANTGTIGGLSASMPSGGSGLGTRLRIYLPDGTTHWESAAIPLPISVPWSATVSLPVGGSQAYWMFIWTDDNAYGVSIPGLYFRHPDCETALPAGPCVPRVKASMPAVAVIDRAILGAALALIPASWWGFLLEWYVGTTIDTGVLCSSLPPSITTIATDLLINPGHGAFDILNATLWPYFCECTPSTTYDPVIPPKPTPPRPPDFPDHPAYPCDPGTPCADFTLIKGMLADLTRLVQRDLELDKLTQRYSLPFGTIPGAVHSGLTGTGSFAVSRLVGLRIAAVDATPVDVWEGNPPYLKDIGWASVSDGGAMLQETRITRSSQDWFPKQMPLATTFGYLAKDGVTLTVTELLAEP